jgi:hypothetical protein
MIRAYARHSRSHMFCEGPSKPRDAPPRIRYRVLEKRQPVHRAGGIDCSAECRHREKLGHPDLVRRGKALQVKPNGAIHRTPEGLSCFYTPIVEPAPR